MQLTVILSDPVAKRKVTVFKCTNHVLFLVLQYCTTLNNKTIRNWDPGTLRKKNLNCAGIQGQIVREKMLIVR